MTEPANKINARAALLWATTELRERQQIAEEHRRPLVFSLTENRDYLPPLLDILERELRRRGNTGPSRRPIEELTPGSAAVRRSRDKKKAEIAPPTVTANE